jgi:hypothetical protein
MISTHIQGIPCQVKMVYGHYQEPWRGSPHDCPSDWDYYGGWVELEFEVYDRKGYRAKWLERKMTPEDEDRIISELLSEEEL